VTVPLGALYPPNGICIVSGGERAADYPAKIVCDDVMVANAELFAMNAIEEFYEFDGLDLEAGLLARLAHHGLVQAFAEFDESAGNGPAALHGLAASLDEKDAALVHDDGAYADQRRQWEFALKHAFTIVEIGGSASFRARCHH
jgi:hypothetical protein